MRVYLAGSIFNEAALKYNEFLLKGIRNAWPGINIYAAQENMVINDKTKSATERDIYYGDYNRLKDTDIFIAVISGDPCPPIGTTAEVGIFSEMCNQDSNKLMITLCHDTRDPAYTYSDKKNEAMKGVASGSQYNYVNLFLTGISKTHGPFLTNSEELFEYIHELWLKEQKQVKCGIYSITNRENGKKYIGQSIDIYSRWKKHISRRNNPHHNSAIEQALGKYGVDTFDLNILELCEKEKLNEREVYWIKKENCYVPDGYNIAVGGQNFTNVNSLKECSCYDLDTGNLVLTYPSIREAARQTGLDRQQISKCCNEKEGVCSCGGFFWQFGHENCLTEDYIKPKGGTSNKKKIYQYDINEKNFITSFESVAEASRQLGDINYNKNISAAARGRRSYAYGYIWSYYKWDVAPDNYRLLNQKKEFE